MINSKSYDENSFFCEAIIAISIKTLFLYSLTKVYEY